MNLKDMHKFKLLCAVNGLSLGHKVVKSNKKLHKTLSMLSCVFNKIRHLLQNALKNVLGD